MSVINVNQPIVIPDPSDPNYGPSANNSASITVSSNLAISLPVITDTNTATIAVVRQSLYPDPTMLYRFTFDYQYTSLAFTGTPVGTLNLSIAIGTPAVVLACSDVRVRQAVPNGNRFIGGSISCVFRLDSVRGNNMFIGLTNDSGATLNVGGSMTINTFCIEEVTSSFNTITSIT